MEMLQDNCFFAPSDAFDLDFIKQLIAEHEPTSDIDNPEPLKSEANMVDEVEAYFIAPSKPLNREPENMFQLSFFK